MYLVQVPTVRTHLTYLTDQPTYRSENVFQTEDSMSKKK